MSVFYCDFHGRLEDSELVGFNEWGEVGICDEGFEEADYEGGGENEDAGEDEDACDGWGGPVRA